MRRVNKVRRAEKREGMDRAHNASELKRLIAFSGSSRGRSLPAVLSAGLELVRSVL